VLTGRLLCIVVGLGWLFVLPLDQFSRGCYISENALLPGQVEAYFGGSELNVLRAYRAQVESWAASEDPDLYSPSPPSPKRKPWSLRLASDARYLHDFEALLQSFQLKTARQYYRLSESVAGIGINGTNVYGILRAPRGDATEAIVLSASWRTSDGRVDVGGVALLMSLAGYFKRTNLSPLPLSSLKPR